MQRYVPLNWNKWICILILVVFLHSYHVRGSNFHDVDICTQLPLSRIPLEVFEECSGAGLIIHCLPNSTNNLGLSCFNWTWISPRKCPYFNTYRGNIDEKDCSPDVGNCPSQQYKSPNSLQYKGCYQKEFPVTDATTTETLTTLMTSTVSTESHSASCPTPSPAPRSDSNAGWIGGIVVAVILAMLSLALLAFVLLKYVTTARQRMISYLQKIDNPERSQENEENISLQE